MSVCCVGPMAAQARPAVRHVQLTVEADDSAWTTTGLVIQPGDRIDIRATGTISVNRYWFRVEANGIRPGSSGERGSAYLEYRIGNVLPKPVGKLAMIESATTGLLQLRLHDTRYDDNDGALQVEVLMVSGAAVPDATEPNEGDTELAGVISTMTGLLHSLVQVMDDDFATRGHYESPFFLRHIALPQDITLSIMSFDMDGKAFAIGLQHFSQPKARCALSSRIRNPMDSTAADREVACQWHDFDPPW